jgi:light-regulated signal transduction histidine kinase (bacteriophytochrome)
MNTESLQTEKFQDKFENLNIYIHQIEVERIDTVIDAVFPYNTPFTGIWNNTNNHFYPPDEKEIVGKIFLMLKNQAEDSKSAIWVDTQFRVSANNGTYSDIVCKFVQYLFDWIEKYVRENNIEDVNGTKFIVPGFLYSKEHFENAFPD